MRERLCDGRYHSAVIVSESISVVDFIRVVDRATDRRSRARKRARVVART